jgi:NAD(P)-dependent dehydrogenase (short-subunit alcohol dehydrogenase family)
MTATELARGPVALVAGASRGLGWLIARELGRLGYWVMICARTGDDLERGAAMLRSEGINVSTMVCDVGDSAAVTRLVERTESDLGPIDVAVCVAGIIQVGPLEALDRSHFEAAMDVMLWGPINVGLEVAQRMRARGRGRIGVITSLGGLISAPHLLPYSTAKFGAVGFARGLRSELSGTGVSVTTVAPGLMRTGSHLRATFLGDHGREFAWFGAAASLPLLSMDAERAAGIIVRGILNRRAVVTTTPLTKIVPRVDALFPGLASAVLAFTTRRLLPESPGGLASRRGLEGWQAEKSLPRRSQVILDGLSTLGRRAAARYNERRTQA